MRCFESPGGRLNSSFFIVKDGQIIVVDGVKITILLTNSGETHLNIESKDIPSVYPKPEVASGS